MTVGQTIAGYRVLAHIGSGAASELYCVQDPKTKQIWALKHVMRQSDKESRFLEQVTTEYQVGSQLDHPAIRKIYRIIRHRKLFRVCEISLLMELVDAQGLDELNLRSALEAVIVFKQVAEGLHYMHSAGYVHADIKPTNILVSESLAVKIIDLGQACRIGTIKKRIQGTPGYMAPEQAHRHEITPKTDIYNFGATMYWVLCREVIPTALPPKDKNDGIYSGALDNDMVSAPVPPNERNPQVHPMLSRCILDCVALNPDDRPESMELIAKRLGLLADLLREGKANAASSQIQQG